MNSENVYNRPKRGANKKYPFISCSRPPRPEVKKGNKMRPITFGKAMYEKHT
jgi:hypothetical protein